MRVEVILVSSEEFKGGKRDGDRGTVGLIAQVEESNNALKLSRRARALEVADLLDGLESDACCRAVEMARGAGCCRDGCQGDEGELEAEGGGIWNS